MRRGQRVGRSTVVVHSGATGAPVVDASQALVGFVVSKAVGNAVRRNRVKRRLRALMSDHLPGLPPGSRVVVRATAAAAGADFGDLKKDVDGALRALERRAGRAR